MKKIVFCALVTALLAGVGGGLFQQDRELNRQEMSAILYRFAEFLKFPTDIFTGTALNYSDSSSIASWAENAALYCQEAGIITGRDGGDFAPAETTTRAEVAAVVQRFIEFVLK